MVPLSVCPPRERCTGTHGRDRKIIGSKQRRKTIRFESVEENPVHYGEEVSFFLECSHVECAFVEAVFRDTPKNGEK